ncbi:hypothetical protein BT96DRAFT_937687 [Gymnopus androsaceus JB14]|uniref:AB hydrolase-1 domain-containing protein n=1 Tax=Gymnopus androsaceus JB14 TaxID=1447944 RepID=A0A6A4HV62_9AGAR|nr:hypothetical protein BT96DRAFT_937687 [Gymnopus androsaceus JB14]
MPTFTLPNEITYFYQDSGAPSEKQDYTTFFIVHGHTYHSALFKPLAFNWISTREYPGSTPYSPEELEVFAVGPDEARLKQLMKDGTDLALLLDGLIVSLSLPQTGGIAIVGWSMGNIFTLPLLASITDLPVETRVRLGSHVKRTIIWDPPCQTMGIAGPQFYTPYYDQALPAEIRPIEFAKWLTFYFFHGDLSKRRLEDLNQRYHDVHRKYTFQGLPLEELFEMIEIAPGAKRCSMALCAKPGGNMKIWYMVGDRNPWNIIYCWWTMEDEVKAAQTSEPAINFTVNEGSNHFFMWDDPEGCMDKLELCCRS